MRKRKNLERTTILSNRDAFCPCPALRARRDGAVPRDRAPPARQRPPLVALEPRGLPERSRIACKVVTSLRSRHADAADHKLRLRDDDGLFAQRRLAVLTAALAAQRRNDPIDFPVSLRGDKRARRKSVAACVDAGRGLAGGGARTRALLRVRAVRRYLMRCRDGRDPSSAGASVTASPSTTLPRLALSLDPSPSR